MLDYLEIPDTDPTLLRQLKTDGDKLMKLQYDMEVARIAYEDAQKAYSDFAIKKLPQLFKDCGVDSITVSSGATLKMVTKTRASIKKGNDDGRASKASICAWLRAHNADSLIKSECVVPASQLDKLKANGITYEEKVDINTNSLKAQICDMLGQKGSPAVINRSDIPEGLSFYQWDEVELA